MARIKVRTTNSFTPLRVRKAVRAGLMAAVEHWHTTMMPGHFTPKAVAKYDYAPRTKKYMIRKARREHHQNPLMYTGDSRDYAKGLARFTSTSLAGTSIATVAMMMPGYFVKHPNKGANFIDKPDELTRTTPDEQEDLGRVMVQTIMRELGLIRAVGAA